MLLASEIADAGSVCHEANSVQLFKGSEGSKEVEEFGTLIFANLR